MNPGDAILMLVRHSCEASVLILLVFAVQKIFRSHLSPQWMCALWLLVMIRLLPISVPSRVSLFNLLPAWATSETPRVAQPAKPAALATLRRSERRSAVTRAPAT